MVGDPQGLPSAAELFALILLEEHEYDTTRTHWKSDGRCAGRAAARVGDWPTLPTSSPSSSPGSSPGPSPGPALVWRVRRLANHDVSAVHGGPEGRGHQVDGGDVQPGDAGEVCRGGRAEG